VSPALFRNNTAAQVLLVAFLALAAALLTFQKELNTNGDNAAYLILAKSLAKGEGLRYINFPDRPKSDSFPVGYPLFLSVFIRLFGYNLMMLKSVMVALFAASMASFFFLAKGVLEGKYLASAMVLTFTNYWLLDNASINMSELLFTQFVIGGLIFFRRSSVEEPGWNLAAACAILVLSIFIRAAGVALLLALLLFLAYRRRFVFAGGVLAAYLVLYFLHKPLMADTGTGYVGVLFLKDPYAPYLGALSIGEFITRVQYNVVFYLGHVIQMTLLSFMSDMESLSPAGVLTFSLLIAGLLLAYPFKAILKSDFDLFLRGFIILYMGVLMVRPEVWSGSRFIVPLIPLFYLAAFQNLQWLGERFFKREYLPRVRNLVLAVAVVWSLLNFGEAFRKSHTPLPSDWVDYNGLAAWAASNTDTSAQFCARSPYIFYLKSGRKCAGIPVKPDPVAGWQYLREKKVDYVVVDRFKWSGSTQKYVVPVLLRYPERFSKVAETGKEGASIFKMNGNAF
jgi:hypothetical protein